MVRIGIGQHEGESVYRVAEILEVSSYWSILSLLGFSLVDIIRPVTRPRSTMWARPGPIRVSSSVMVNRSVLYHLSDIIGDINFVRREYSGWSMFPTTHSQRESLTSGERR